MMDELSNKYRMHIQTLREQTFGAKVIRASYPDKNWSLSALQTICCRVDETGSAVTRRAGSGRLKSVLLQLVNILNIVPIMSRQLIFISGTFELLTKSYTKFDSLFVSIQGATARSLKK